MHVPPLEQLERQLASKRVLLLLDNLAQVIEFADGIVAPSGDAAGVLPMLLE